MCAKPLIQLPQFTEITTSVQVNCDRHQFVYASQLYGTFFVVSGKFSFSNEKLIEIELKLINYNGPLNIGMLDGTKLIHHKQIKKLTIMLHLKAMEGKHGHGKSIKFENLDFDVNDLDELLVDRELYKFGDRPNITDHLDDMVFDSEFFERDGAVIREKDHRDRSPIHKNGALLPVTSSNGMCRDTKAFFIK